MLFGAAAVRIPLTTIGLLQYVAPIIQFIIGVAIKHEYMPTSRWAGFVLVWAAVAVFTWDSLRRARRPVAVTVRGHDPRSVTATE
jgi:chloramphenicol-sensitive protein RarD